MEINNTNIEITALKAGKVPYDITYVSEIYFIVKPSPDVMCPPIINKSMSRGEIIKREPFVDGKYVILMTDDDSKLLRCMRRFFVDTRIIDPSGHYVVLQAEFESRPVNSPEAQCKPVVAGCTGPGGQS